MNTVDTIKYYFKNTGIVEKLIYINISIFILVYIVNTFGFLFEIKKNILINWLSLPSGLDDFIVKPWSIITYGFLHTDFIHLFLNLIALFFIGNLFKEYFSSKQLLSFYIYGTLFGGILYILSYNFFPVFSSTKNNNILIGASAGIYSILIGISTYLPNYQFKIPLLGFIKLWHIAAVWVILDIIQIPVSNTGGHFSHLGGAIFGFFYVYNTKNSTIAKNTKEKSVFEPFTNLFKKKEKTPLKAVYNSGKKTAKPLTYKNKNQQEIDAILDKISKSGYDTLTKEEKEFLFKQGKK